MHTVIYLPEYTISPAIWRRRRVVQEVVIGEIDKELTGRRMWIRCACQGNRAARITKSVLGFIGDRFVGGLLCHAWTKPTSLNDKIGDDAMDQRTFIEPCARVGQEVFNAFRCRVGKEFEYECTESGL